MPRFFLHIVDRYGRAPDEEGREFDSARQAREAAVKGARSLLIGELEQGRLDLRGRIEVADDRQGVADVVEFADVVDILRGPLPGPESEDWQT
jgi:hypothetical protein